MIDQPLPEDRLPRVCLVCVVQYPFIWNVCPRCGSTRYRDQETGKEHDSAEEPAP